VRIGNHARPPTTPSRRTALRPRRLKARQTRALKAAGEAVRAPLGGRCRSWLRRPGGWPAGAIPHPAAGAQTRPHGDHQGGVGDGGPPGMLQGRRAFCGGIDAQRIAGWRRCRAPTSNCRSARPWLVSWWVVQESTVMLVKLRAPTSRAGRPGPSAPRSKRHQAGRRHCPPGPATGRPAPGSAAARIHRVSTRSRGGRENCAGSPWRPRAAGIR